MDYEKDPVPSFEEIFSLAKGAYKKFLEKKLVNNVILTTDIIIDVDQKLIRLPHNKNELEIFETEKFENGGKYVNIKLTLDF